MTSSLPSETQIDAKPVRIIRPPEVLVRTGLSRSSVYERMKDKTFPAAIGLGGRSVGWLESEVTDWILGCVSTTRKVVLSVSAARKAASVAIMKGRVITPGLTLSSN